ncbi:MAG: EamA family transporter [bacterium]|nr:EamA family transporter [bacterium]
MIQAILPAIASMVLFGLADFIYKKAFDQGVNAIVIYFYSMVISTGFFGVLCIARSVSIQFSGNLPVYSIGLGILIFAAVVFGMEALKIGDASIVVPITRMGFIITAILAFIFLGEELTVTRGLGILSAVGAILLLSKK